MRRILLVLAVAGVWLITFFVTLASTDPTLVDCNDTPTVGVAAACAVPGPSLLPALPLATLVAAAVVAVAMLRRRRQRAG